MSTYGIVWGRDDRSGDIIPTCNRVVKESILDSSAYRVAISECADEQREIYSMRAAHIDRIQKKIKRDMEMEEDFDVFISFKAKNADGSITEDSIIARRIYDELTQRGIKTFFSEVTLKGRIGDDYEPIIYPEDLVYYKEDPDSAEFFDIDYIYDYPHVKVHWD